MRKALLFALSFILLFSVFSISASAKDDLDTVTLNVYNWGQYISDGEDDLPDTNALFEEYFNTYLAKSYGYYIEVNYSTYPSNEDLRKAMNVLTVCVKLSAVEKLIAEK